MACFLTWIYHFGPVPIIYRITDAVMGNALFPDSDVVSNVERVRKVVRPKAKWLMNPSVLQAIEAQVLRPK